MFLIYPATNLLVDKNSVKYGLHTKIVPQERYGTRVLTSDACGMRRHLVYGMRVLTSNACGTRQHLRCSRCTAFFEQSIPVWNRLSYHSILATYVIKDLVQA